MFADSICSLFPFSLASQKKISWLIKNHIRIGTIELMKKIKQYEFMMHPYFEDLITLYAVDNLGKIPPDTDCARQLNILYKKFKEKLSSVQFLN